ncbi:MAG: carbamoyltransferase HypF [Nitrosomonas sp.]|nr:carbamoyltransferase HypF [Nitrosomonas sp.]
MAEIAPSAITQIDLPACGPAVLACGAWLKNTICLTQGNKAYLSPVIGDLDNAEARRRLDDTVAAMCHRLKIEPEIAVHDLHPDFYSTEFACAFAAQMGIPVMAVQHHHAHIAAVCAEHQVAAPVLGLALDGVGLGTDNTSWGGELLRVDGCEFQRIGHLAPLALPGGDRAAREPWRMAAAAMAKLGRIDEIVQRFHGQPAAQSVAAMLQNNINCPQTSSMGRLFDAAAGLLGVCLVQSHEAQAAIALQQLAEKNGPADALMNGYRITDDNLLDFSPLLGVIVNEPDFVRDVAKAAAVFHATLSAGLAAWARRAAQYYGVTRLALGGGCFHNGILLKELKNRLEGCSISLLSAEKLPPDDSAIALGQAWIALQTLQKT